MALGSKNITILCLAYALSAGVSEASWATRFFGLTKGWPAMSFRSILKPYYNKLWPQSTSMAPILTNGYQKNDRQHNVLGKYSLYALLGLGAMQAMQAAAHAEELPEAVMSNSSKKQVTLEEFTAELAADNKFSHSISWRYFSRNLDEIYKASKSCVMREGSQYPDAFQYMNKMYETGGLPLPTIFSREIEYSQNYTVFYHAHAGSVRVLQDLFAELASFLHEQEKPQDFIYLRNPTQNCYSKSYLFSKHERFDPAAWQAQQKSSRRPWDHDPKIQEKVLSVNVHLFGNIKRPSYGESSIIYYILNTSSKAHKNISLCEFLKAYNLKYDDTIIDELEKKVSTHSSLLQIFIPKTKTPNCMYIAHPGEKAVCGNGRCMKHKALLRELGLAYTPDLEYEEDCLQARIFLDHNIMLNPNSGVKIFRYTTISIL